MTRWRAIFALVVGLAALTPFGASAYPLGPTYCVDEGLEQHLGTLQPTFTHDGITYSTLVIISLNRDPDEPPGPRTSFLVTASFDYTHAGSSSSFTLEKLLGSPAPERWPILLREWVHPGSVYDHATISAEAPICITVSYAPSLLDLIRDDLGASIENGELPPPYAKRLPVFVELAERRMQMGHFQASIKHLEHYITHVEDGMARQQVDSKVGEILIFGAKLAINDLSGPDKGNQEPINSPYRSSEDI